MNIYVLILFLHIIGAGCIFIGLGMEGIILKSLNRATTTDQVFNLAGSMKLLRFTFIIAFILLLIPGIYMAVDSWGWAAWVITGFVLLLVLSALGNITGKKIVDVLKSLKKSNEPLSMEIKEKLSAPFFIKLYKIKILMAVGIVFIMTLKTGWIATIITIAVSFGIGILLGVPANEPVKEIKSA